MTIGKKIAFGFTATIVVTMVAGLVSHHSLTAIRSVTEDISSNSLIGYKAIVGINDKAQTSATDLAELLNSPDAATAAALEKDIQDNAAGLEKNLADYQQAVGDDEVDAKNLERLIELRKISDPVMGQIIALTHTGQFKEARAIFLRSISIRFCCLYGAN